jgi:hypothetical protein
LPKAVRGRSEFETIGANQVDGIVEHFLDSFGIAPVLAEQKEDRSDAASLRFWQGTSAMRASVGPTAVLSLHAVRFGSNVLVSIFYVTSDNSVPDVRAVDAVMASLDFARQ